MTDIVERAKELRAGITRGPWKLKTMRREKYQPDVVHTPHGCLWHPSMGNINNRADGEFIAAAPELVDGLIAEVERLRALQRDDQETAKQAIEERDEANAAVERVRELAEQLAAPTALTGQTSILGRAIAEEVLNAIHGTTPTTDELGGEVSDLQETTVGGSTRQCGRRKDES